MSHENMIIFSDIIQKPNGPGKKGPSHPTDRVFVGEIFWENQGYGVVQRSGIR